METPEQRGTKKFTTMAYHHHRHPFVHSFIHLFIITSHWPSVGSGVVTIDPFRFLAGCRTRRLNQALSDLCPLSLGFF